MQITDIISHTPFIYTHKSERNSCWTHNWFRYSSEGYISASLSKH